MTSRADDPAMVQFHGRLWHAGCYLEVGGLISAMPDGDGERRGLIIAPRLGVMAMEDGPIVLEIEQGRTGAIVITS